MEIVTPFSTTRHPCSGIEQLQCPRKLLSKMDSYGIRGPINNWLNMFLPQRKMKAVVEGEQSEEVVVDSGAVRDSSWIVLFLCCTNNLPYAVKSTIRLLTDDCLLYRTIK
jgi:hypothetical protein